MDELKNSSYGQKILNMPIREIEDLSKRLEYLRDNPDDFDFWFTMYIVCYFV